MSARILSVNLQQEADVVLARQRARQIAEQLGFSPLEQTQIATAVSEIARNAYDYGGGGLVEYSLTGKRAPTGPGDQNQRQGQGHPGPAGRSGGRA